MAQARYEVPVIHHNVRQEDTILQIADALEFLEKCFSDIVSHVEGRISAKKLELVAIRKRTAAVKAKIGKLKGSKKATKVVASAKYPAVDVYHDYASIFERLAPVPINRHTGKLKSKNPPIGKHSSQELLQFYHVKATEKTGQHPYNCSGLEEGLGSLPQSISSVSSLLLFNTAENPYKQYKMLDPLGSARKMKQASEPEEDGKKLEAAPVSITQKEFTKRLPTDKYFYSPGLGEVPQIDVPTDLPDLPGIVDDLQFCMDSGPMIAPSLSSSHVPVTVSHDSAPTCSVKPVVLEDKKTTSPSVSQLAPLQSRSFEPADPPPPPPPPPPTAPVEVQTQATDTDHVKTQTTLPCSDDVHANLMEAIRQAGGSAKLKSASERKSISKKKKQEFKGSTTSSGDLMADLHAKLSLRRKGISGANKPETVSNALARISAMIPPPPRLETSLSTGEDDSDWDS